MDKHPKKLSKIEAELAKKRYKDYIASMAIEGIHLTKEERAILDDIYARGIGYEEALKEVEAWLDQLDASEEDANG